MRPAAAATALVLAVITAGCHNRAEALYDSAERLWLHDQHQEAVQKLQLIVAEYPESNKVAAALYRLGEIHYLNLDDAPKALDYFIKVTRHKGNSGLILKTHEYIAQIYEKSLRQYGLAILEYQRILNEFKGQIKQDEYRFRIGNVYFTSGAYEQAIVEYQTLLEEFPGSDLALDARRQMANCRFIMGDPKQAEQDYQSLLKDYPGSKYEYDIRLGVGASYEETDRLGKALAVYKQMVKDYPGRQLVARKIDSVERRINSRKR